MKKIALLILPLLVCSCQWFDAKAPDKEELLQQRLKEINWSEVSSYPSVAECNAIIDKEQRKECFFETMARLVQEKLDNDTISMLYPGLDTIKVKVKVYSDARLEFEPGFEKDSVRYDTVVIDSIIKSRLVNFPPVEPAQKEGVPVTTEFILPVVLNVK
jgi:hypothetical protein